MPQFTRKIGGRKSRVRVWLVKSACAEMDVEELADVM